VGLDHSSPEDSDPQITPRRRSTRTTPRRRPVIEDSVSPDDLPMPDVSPLIAPIDFTPRVASGSPMHSSAERSSGSRRLGGSGGTGGIAPDSDDDDDAAYYDAQAAQQLLGEAMRSRPSRGSPSAPSTPTPASRQPSLQAAGPLTSIGSFSRSPSPAPLSPSQILRRYPRTESTAHRGPAGHPSFPIVGVGSRAPGSEVEISSRRAAVPSISDLGGWDAVRGTPLSGYWYGRHYVGPADHPRAVSPTRNPYFPLLRYASGQAPQFARAWSSEQAEIDQAERSRLSRAEDPGYQATDADEPRGNRKYGPGRIRGG
jgi:hypothetical protein